MFGLTLFQWHPLWKIPFGLSEHNFYTFTYTYIDSLSPKGQISSFKTLEMRATQSSAELDDQFKNKK